MIDTTKPAESFDAVVVGAGFAGMYMLIKLRELGFTAQVIEAGTEVGGTWYWNRYPGARCDVESLDYQYSFSEELQREWNWSERYATQPEILRYASFVADKFDLRRDIKFQTRVTSARWDESAARWDIGTDNAGRYSAKFLIAGTGCLSAASTPQFDGLDSFNGATYHTGRWPHEGVDFTGKRVAVIGTGSSGIQSIPVIAGQADRVYVFQRTPNYSLPAANYMLDRDKIDHYRSNFQAIKAEARKSRSGIVIQPPDKSVFDVPVEEREKEFSERWVQGGFQMIQAYKDLVLTNEANEVVAEFVRSKIRESVKDPGVAEDLSPRDHPLGTKRICIDTDYYKTYNRDNVTLINIRKHPIEGMTPNGVKTADAEYEVDAIVFATGFDAMTGALFAMNIEGKGGEKLNDKWAAGPRTYLGLSTAGFPNLFTITGPGSPSVFSNMIISIEQHVDWIAECMEYMREHGAEAIDASKAAEDAWVEHVNELANMTLYPQANSWYLGANIPGKPRVFMPYAGGVGTYREKCDQIAAAGYEGFSLQRAAVTA
ncbi:MAG: flavin-containing monooxygenase [Dehalococcoidia bacterium]